MYHFLVIIEKGETSYGAYSPDLPGCFAVGETREEAERLMYEAMQEHIRWMLEDGDTIPEPVSAAVYMAIPEVEPAKAVA
jgi:predicted RNase H-like HicB family nuclease